VKVLRPLVSPFLALADVFREPNLRKLQLAWLASNTGGWAWVVALSVYAFEHDGARGLALVGFLRMLANAVPAPFASALADRYPRRRVMIASDLARVVLLGLSAAAAWAGSPIAVYALTLAFSVAMAPFRSAQAALLPSLTAAPEQLTAANAASSTIESVGMFAGPALGGLLLAVSSPATAFAATAGAIAWSAVLIVGIRVEEPRPAREATAGRLAELLAGFTAIARESRLRLLVGLFVAQTAVAGALMVLIVVASLDFLDAGDAGVGYLNSAIGVGGLLGGVVALAGGRRLGLPFGLGILLWGVPIALVGVFANTVAALVLLALVGVGNSLVDVSAFTLLQRAVPDEVLGRVFGVLEGLALTSIAVGSLVAGPLADAVGIRWALVATGAFLPALAALVWPRLLALDAEAPVPEAEVELLRSLQIFAPLFEPVLEELASELEPVTVAAGDTIVRQGEPGDRFYVVADGELDVTVDGRPAVPLGPGDSFGEIALVRNVPRTATVTARTDATLYGLGRDVFLSAVTGHPETTEAAEAVVATRLSTLRPAAVSL
jgi:MFS family permease